MKKLSALYVSVLLLSSLCSCSDTESPSVTENSEAAAVDYFEGKTKLVYLNTVPYGSADSEIQNELNRLLDERGCNFAVEFRDIEEMPDGSQSCLSVYEGMLESGQQADIIFTGVSINDTAEGTYSQFIEKGYLEPFNSYFDTKNGQRLYSQFDEKYWDRMTYTDGNIYGKSAAYTVSAPLSLHINPQNYDISDFDDTFECLIDTLKKVTAETGAPSLLLESGDISYENYFGFTTYKGIYINSETGLAENIFENPEFSEYVKLIAELTANGCATTNSELVTDESLVAYIGTYNYLYAGENDIIIGDSYYSSYGISSATGIAKNSQHKDEAFELMVLLNTDTELANLLYNGIEGRNYTLKDGHAIEIEGSAMPYSFAALTPANPVIALPKEDESLNKQANLDYQTEYVRKSPVFGLDYESERLEQIAKIYDEYYGLFYGAYDNTDAVLDEANRKLESAGLSEVLDDINSFLEVHNEAENN